MATLALPAVIDTATVASLRDQILQHRGEDLVLDGSTVHRIGGLGLQVLLATARLWSAEGHAFSLTSRSESLTEMLRLTDAQTLPELSQ